jgi:uncharacterized transporter YbjL
MECCSFFQILKSNFKFENQKITTVDQKNNIYNIHNIKLLIVFLFSKIIEKICKSQYEIKKNNVVTKRIFKNKRIKKITEPIPKKTQKSQKSENKNNEDVIKIKNDKIIISTQKENEISVKNKTKNETKNENKYCYNTIKNY